MSSDAMLVKFKQSESLNSVTRQTVRQMAKTLGFNDTQVVQFALAKLRAEVLPAYQPDSGPVPAAMIRHIRQTSDQDDYTPTRSLIPDL